MTTEAKLDAVLNDYAQAFRSKTYGEENEDVDVLMEVFGVSPAQKRENRQYWGRELGMCWQRLVVSVARDYRRDFEPGLRIGADEPCDLRFGGFAIDTKYRIGSGDSGTLKKFRSYGPLLAEKGYQPVLLLLRTDNLKPAIAACKAGGWAVHMGDESFEFLKEHTKFNLRAALEYRKGRFGFAD